MPAPASELKLHAIRRGRTLGCCLLLTLCLCHAGAQQKPAADKPLRLTTRGYEVSMDTAAALFGLPAAELHPSRLLAALTTLAAKGEASIVKMPVTEVSLSGTPGTTVVEGEFSLQASLLNAKVGGPLRSIAYTLFRKTNQAGGTLVIFTLAGQVSFLGTLPGASEDRLVLVFGHLSQA